MSRHDWLHLIPNEFVECRQIRHAWEGGRDLYDFGNGITGRVLRCGRCGCRREELFANGRRISNKMKYPDDYAKPKGAPKGRVESSEVFETLLEGTRLKRARPPAALVEALTRLRDR